MDTKETQNTESTLLEAERDLRASPTQEETQPDLLTWLSTSALARAEGTTARQVYMLIDQGLPHSRIGGRLRLRRCDWHSFHLKHMKGQVV